MAARLRPQSSLSFNTRPARRGEPIATVAPVGIPIGPASLVAAGVLGAGAVVWQFANPALVRLTDGTAWGVALGASALVGVGLFTWLDPSRATGQAPAAGDEAGAARVREQLRQGRAVSWGGPVYLLPNGVQANGRVYPWSALDLSRARERGRQLLLFAKDQPEPVAAVPLSAGNARAGWTAVQQLAAAGAAPARIAIIAKPTPRAAA